MQTNFNPQKVSWYFKSHSSFSWYSPTGVLVPVESLNWKGKQVPMFSKTLSLGMTRHYNLLITENILKFFSCKGQDNLQSIAIKILDYKFPLIYRQTFNL